MRQVLMFLMAFLSLVMTGVPVMAKDQHAENMAPVVGSGQQRAYKGKYHFVTEEGDSCLMIVMNTITVYPPLKFKNKKQYCS